MVAGASLAHWGENPAWEAAIFLGGSPGTSGPCCVRALWLLCNSKKRSVALLKQKKKASGRNWGSLESCVFASGLVQEGLGSRQQVLVDASPAAAVRIDGFAPKRSSQRLPQQYC